MQVVLDPSLTKTQSREVRELRQELEKAGMVKGMQQRAALLPLFEKTGRLKLPAVRYRAQDFVECNVDCEPGIWLFDSMGL